MTLENIIDMLGTLPTVKVRRISIIFEDGSEFSFSERKPNLIGPTGEDDDLD